MSPKTTVNVRLWALVRVIWVDSASHDGWKTETELKEDEEPMTCETVGFLIRKPTKKLPVYFVSSSRSLPPPGTESQFSCTMKIPKVCVKEIKEIKEIEELLEPNTTT